MIQVISNGQEHCRDGSGTWLVLSHRAPVRQDGNYLLANGMVISKSSMHVAILDSPALDTVYFGAADSMLAHAVPMFKPYHIVHIKICIPSRQNIMTNTPICLEKSSSSQVMDQIGEMHHPDCQEDAEAVCWDSGKRKFLPIYGYNLATI